MKPPQVSTCVFCKEAIKSSCFAESPHFMAIYNIAPILPGHSLVIPKEHHQSVLELEEAKLCEMMLFSQKIIKLLGKAFQREAFDWTIQDGKAAGQTVMHLHAHIIPRQEGDFPEPGDWYPALQKQESAMIDSQFRPRLNSVEMAKIIKYLQGITVI